MTQAGMLVATCGITATYLTMRKKKSEEKKDVSDKRATAESRAWQPHNKRSSHFLCYTSLSGGLFKLRLIFPKQPELSVNYLVQRKPSSQTRKHTRWHTHTRA